MLQMQSILIPRPQVQSQESIKRLKSSIKTIWKWNVQVHILRLHPLLARCMHTIVQFVSSKARLRIAQNRSAPINLCITGIHASIANSTTSHFQNHNSPKSVFVGFSYISPTVKAIQYLQSHINTIHPNKTNKLTRTGKC